jgi:hypothetical protein
MSGLRAIFLFMAAVGMAAASIPAHASDDWEVVKTFRILHLNIYGREKAGCKERFRSQAEHILSAMPRYDIITLNEHWRSSIAELVGHSCDGNVLSDAILADPRYRSEKGRSRSRLSYPKGHWYKLHVNGGDSIITSERIADFKSFVFGRTNNAQIGGYSLARVEFMPGVALDTWFTHLEARSDDCNEACLQSQMRNIADSVARHSSQSGNPVIVTGDFNMGGPPGLAMLEAHELDAETFPYVGNEGYDFWMSYFKNPRDLWIESLRTRNDRVTEGATAEPRKNPLIGEHGLGERIDFMFVPRNRAYVNSSLKLRLKSMDVVRWETPRGVPVSDHYGLDATIEIVRRAR